jgi:hypothetical protein
MLAFGIAAGLLFPVVSFAQAFTRDGFDLRRHAISALSLGDLGLLQVTNFVLTGVLAVVAAVGIRTALPGGRASVAGPILVGVYGVGMIGGGLFPPDPALGWPAGAPDGLPQELSTTSLLHTAAAVAAFMSLIAAGPVFAARFAAHGRPRWAVYSAANGVATFTITTPPWGASSESLRYAVGAVLISTWLLAVSLRFRIDAR